jgi:hypothetical protein
MVFIGEVVVWKWVIIKNKNKNKTGKTDKTDKTGKKRRREETKINKIKLLIQPCNCSFKAWI